MNETIVIAQSLPEVVETSGGEMITAAQETVSVVTVGEQGPPGSFDTANFPMDLDLLYQVAKL